MHFFLKCMCFTRKGMCSSAMNNVPNGTTLYYLAGIRAELHIHSLMAMSPAPQQDTHQPCHSQVPKLTCRTLPPWEPQMRVRGHGGVLQVAMFGKETGNRGFFQTCPFTTQKKTKLQLTRLRFYCLSQMNILPLTSIKHPLEKRMDLDNSKLNTGNNFFFRLCDLLIKIPPIS